MQKNARSGLSRRCGDGAVIVKLNASAIKAWKKRDQIKKQASGEYAGYIDNSIIKFPNRQKKYGLIRFARFMLWKTDFRASIRDTISEIIRKHKIDLANPENADAVRQSLIEGAADAGVEISSSKVVSQAAEMFNAVPRTWEEATNKAPGLKSWAEYREANPDRSIVDYLADPDGLGRWTLKEPGIPRPALKKLYPITDPERPEVGSPYKALENWLGRTNRKTQERNQIPTYMHLPDLSTEIDRLATLYQVTGGDTARVAATLRARERKTEKASAPERG